MNPIHKVSEIVFSYSQVVKKKNNKKKYCDLLQLSTTENFVRKNKFNLHDTKKRRH